jgi:hypothetical protein
MLLGEAFFARAEPWYAQPAFRRHATPDLVAAATCAVLLLPPLQATSFAEGMGQAVALQVILAFLDLPIVYALTILLRWRPPFALLVALVVAIYALEGAWFCLQMADKPQGITLAFALLLLLPLALRAISMSFALRDRESAAMMGVLSVSLVMPWMISFGLVALPLATVFGLQREIEGSGAVDILPAAWNAMGVLYFSLVAMMRWVVATHATAPTPHPEAGGAMMP